jgi:hypothetical protein
MGTNQESLCWVERHIENNIEQLIITMVTLLTSWLQDTIELPESLAMDEVEGLRG